MTKKWLGIYIGAANVFVSLYQKTGCTFVLQTPAYITITQTGEILSGERAQRYFSTHRDAPLYSIFDMMKDGRHFRNNHIVHKGIKRNATDICVKFAKDLKSQLKNKLGEEIENCILSVSTGSLFYREHLKRIMSEAGFTVIRILDSSLSCGIAEYQNRTIKQPLLTLSVEHNIINASLVEYSDEVGEVFCTKEFSADGVSHMDVEAISHMGYLFMSKTYPEFKNELSRAVIKVYSNNCPVNKDDVKMGHLGLYASEGAAIIGAILTNNLKNLCWFDVTSYAYGIEIIDKKGSIIKPLQWVIHEQSTVPTRSIMEWKCESSGDNLILRVYCHPEKKKEEAETFETSLKNAINNISGANKKLSISLNIDTNKSVTSEICNTETKVYHTLHMIAPYPAKNVNNLGMLGNPIRLWHETQKELSKVQKIISQLTASEVTSPTGKGLLMIAKQCNQFSRKYAVTEFQRCVRVESEMKQIIDDLLLIVDNIEYGIKNISEKTNDKLEMHLMESYLNLLDFLKTAYAVSPIPAEGMLFDFNIHYAVMHETDPNLSENLVADEIHKGYYWKNKVFRLARVKVVN